MVTLCRRTTGIGVSEEAVAHWSMAVGGVTLYKHTPGLKVSELYVEGKGLRSFGFEGSVYVHSGRLSRGKMLGLSHTGSSGCVHEVISLAGG